MFDYFLKWCYNFYISKRWGDCMSEIEKTIKGEANLYLLEIIRMLKVKAQHN